MIKIFIGFDPRESIAWHVLAHSIFKHAQEPISITPLYLKNLTSIFTRPRDQLQSTDFSFSRFLVPYLSNYQGWSIFMDCDMLARADISELWSMQDSKYSVMCVKHAHNPTETKKFLGSIQTKYQKKNWSSLMLFNNEKCQKLTPEYINSASGLDLHQFKWIENENEIGEIPSAWNKLVGHDPYDPNAKLVHFTIGGPYFNEYQNCDYSEEWEEMLTQTMHVKQI